MIEQKLIQLNSRRKGIYLITNEIVSQLGRLPEKGLLNIFIQHTSASLSINENADPDVRHDFEKYFDMIVPENMPFLKHTLEGPDDMPAHVKSALTSTSITIPIVAGRLGLGTWQGIYLCEFRTNKHSRRILCTIYS